MNEKPKEKTYYYWRNKCIQKEMQIEEFIKELEEEIKDIFAGTMLVGYWSEVLKRIEKLAENKFGDLKNDK